MSFVVSKKKLESFANWCNPVYHNRKQTLREYLIERKIIKEEESFELEKDLRGANLQWINLEGLDLVGANLSGANLCNASLKRSNLERADLSCANLTKVNLTAARLKQAILHGANLSIANLENANIKSADLSCSYMNKTILRNVQYNEQIKLNNIVALEIDESAEIIILFPRSAIRLIIQFYSEVIRLRMGVDSDLSSHTIYGLGQFLFCIENGKFKDYGQNILLVQAVYEGLKMQSIWDLEDHRLEGYIREKLRMYFDCPVKEMLKILGQGDNLELVTNYIRCEPEQAISPSAIKVLMKIFDEGQVYIKENRKWLSKELFEAKKKEAKELPSSEVSKPNIREEEMDLGSLFS